MFGIQSFVTGVVFLHRLHNELSRIVYKWYFCIFYARRAATAFSHRNSVLTLNAKIGGYMDFLAISGCNTSLYHSQGGATLLSLCDSDSILT